MNDNLPIQRLCLSWLISCIPIYLSIGALHHLANLRNGEALALQVMTGLMSCALQLAAGVLVLRRLLARQQRTASPSAANSRASDC